MNNTSIRDKFFDLWSNRLSHEEAREIQNAIQSDSNLQKEYEKGCALFESLAELSEERVVIPHAFAAAITEKIDRGGFLHVLWSKVMDSIRSDGWIRQSYRVGAAAATIGLAVFIIRSSETNYYAATIDSNNEVTQKFLNKSEISQQPAPPVLQDAQAPAAQRVEAKEHTLTERVEGIIADSFRESRKRSPTSQEALAAIGAGEAIMPVPMSDIAFIPEQDRETYGQYDENPRLSVQTEPVSTFSLDVDTGSYANVRRFLRLGQLPPKNAVRIEELINYFPYNYSADGDKPFSVHYEIAPSPLSKGRYLLKVGLKAKPSTQDRSKGWNLVFLVDTSGSMNEPNKLPLVKQSLKLLTDSMRKEDRISLVTYAGNAGVVLPSTSGEEKDKIRNAIDMLGAGGSTHGSAGIDLAYSQAEINKIAGSVNRVILATDGDFNVGISDFNGLVDLIERKRKSGITLTTLGFGTGNYQERSMEQLANKGNGNYFYIDSFQESKKVLSSELTQAMEVVAKDVKIQVEFNPAQVKEYRLIGFDNRMLKKEDFTNDAVDAGEVGSGHIVTALYELELTSRPVSGSISLRYQPKQEEATIPQLQGELGFLKLRAKTPEGNTSTEDSYPIASGIVQDSIDKTSDDFRFAAAVAGFGTMLRDSKYKGDFNWDQIRALAERARGEDTFGYRSEFLTLIDAAKVLDKN